MIPGWFAHAVGVGGGIIMLVGLAALFLSGDALAWVAIGMFVMFMLTIGWLAWLIRGGLRGN